MKGLYFCWSNSSSQNIEDLWLHAARRSDRTGLARGETAHSKSKTMNHGQVQPKNSKQKGHHVTATCTKQPRLLWVKRQWADLYKIQTSHHTMENKTARSTFYFKTINSQIGFFVQNTQNQNMFIPNGLTSQSQIEFLQLLKHSLICISISFSLRNYTWTQSSTFWHLVIFNKSLTQTTQTCYL